MTCSSVWYGLSPGTISPRTEAFILQAILELTVDSVTQSCLTLCGPMAYSPARLFCPWNFPGKYTGVGCLFYTRGSAQPRDWTQVSCISCIGRWILHHWATWEVRWEYQTTLPASWETCMQAKKQQLELYMEQQTGSKLGKEYMKAVYFPPAYLIYIQSTSSEMLGWMKHKLGSKLQEKYQ